MSPLLRLTVLAGVSLAVVTGCTEVPSDIGVHKHRSTATRPRPRAVVHHPSVAYWNDDPSLKGGTKILINLTKQQAFFFRGKVVVGSTNISSGRRDYETPPGKYRVTQKDAHHVSSEYGQYVARSGAVLIHDADINRTRPPRGAPRSWWTPGRADRPCPPAPPRRPSSSRRRRPARPRSLRWR